MSRLTTRWSGLERNKVPPCWLISSPLNSDVRRHLEVPR
jgi:hypothetical protein